MVLAIVALDFSIKKAAKVQSCVATSKVFMFDTKVDYRRWPLLKWSYCQILKITNVSQFCQALDISIYSLDAGLVLFRAPRVTKCPFVQVVKKYIRKSITGLLLSEKGQFDAKFLALLDPSSFYPVLSVAYYDLGILWRRGPTSSGFSIVCVPKC